MELPKVDKNRVEKDQLNNEGIFLWFVSIVLVIEIVLTVYIIC